MQREALQKGANSALHAASTIPWLCVLHAYPTHSWFFMLYASCTYSVVMCAFLRHRCTRVCSQAMDNGTRNEAEEAQLLQLEQALQQEWVSEHSRLAAFHRSFRRIAPPLSGFWMAYELVMAAAMLCAMVVLWTYNVALSQRAGELFETRWGIGFGLVHVKLS